MDHSRNTAINTHTHVYIYIYIPLKKSQVQQTEIHKIHQNTIQHSKTYLSIQPASFHGQVSYRPAAYTASPWVSRSAWRCWSVDRSAVPPTGSGNRRPSNERLKRCSTDRRCDLLGAQLFEKNISNRYPKLYVQWLEWKSIFLWRFQI